MSAGYENQTSEFACVHCWHDFRGPLWIVLPDGHVVQKCCHCEQTRTIHVEHAHGREESR